MSAASNRNNEIIQKRAQLYAQIRQYFLAQNVLEVDTPLLNLSANPDPHITLIHCHVLGEKYFLQSSPELAMKKLLANGSGSIYQISKAFREGEHSLRHRPEFSLLEWYRVGWDYQQLLDEVAFLVRHLIHSLSSLPRYPCIKITYHQALMKYAGIDLNTTRIKEIKNVLFDYGDFAHFSTEPMEIWLDLLMSFVVIPKLGQEQLTFVYDYPVNQASLAQIKAGDPPLAMRFELYLQGLELANGYQELNNAKEQKIRFDKDNIYRTKHGQKEINIDTSFLAQLDALPFCSGVAIGIDRLLMCICQEDNIQSVIF